MDGIWEVELADLDDGVLLARAVATVMGLSDQPGHSTAEVVIEYLRHREVLLILDNCEHLVHAIGPFVDELLQSCLALRVLLTSRKSLLIYGERKFEVTPLPVPPDVAEVTAVDVWEFDAARLFVERARERTSRFEFTDASAPSVAQVCRSVAGMPLAIELAAARLTVLSVEEIAVQVSESIRVLGTDLRGRVLRHKSLRAAMDWSYEWLGPVEQVVLCQLGVFRGSFDLDAARSVTTFDTSDDLTLEDIVAALLESSMLTAVASLGGHARFRLLEPIRHYAYEKLELTPDALAAASRRHADHYLRVAESLEPALMGPNRSTALEILDSAQDNLQSALRWTLAAELTGPALRLAAAPWRYWYIRGRLREGRQSLDRALALATRESSVQPELRAKALYAAGTLTSYLGEYDAARERLEESVDLFRALHDRDGMMRALNNLGITAFEQGDYAGALRLYQESMELHRQLNDPARLAISLVNLAGAAAEVGDLSLARRYAAESLAISRDMGDTLGVAPSLATLAVISGYEGDRETAMRLARDCLEISQALGSRQGVAEALRLIGQFAHEEGDLRHARSVFEESLAIERDIGNSRSIASMLRYLGEVAYDEGDLQEAIRMFRESRDICQQIGRRRGRVDALIGLGRALCRKGHLAEATLTLGEAMHVAHELDHERTLLLVIESHALLADRLDDPERTLRLASFAEAWRAAAGMPVSPIRGAEIAEVVRSARARLTPSAADGATASGRSLTLAQAIKQATSAEW
jgi:predicted ATPase